MAAAEMRPEVITIGRKEFAAIAQLVRDRFGLDLKPGKEALVAARLGKYIRERGLAGFPAYLEQVRRDSSGAELSLLIDSLTTNYTSFLREPSHFEFLRQIILPQLAGRRSFTIWSAGCATGEEPYSIAFCLADALGPEVTSQVRIQATDISARALERASAGVYPKDRFADLPAPWLPRFLQKGQGRWAGYYRVCPKLRQMVVFQRLNLMEDFSRLEHVPLIFCRNVMIYFDKPTQENLVQRFADRLEPGGYLFVGHSEGLMSFRHGLDYVRPAIYRRPAPATELRRTR